MVRVWGEHRRLPVLVRRNGRMAVGSISDGERRLGGSWARMRPVRERRASRAGPVWRPGPKAQEGVCEQAAGQNRKRAPSTEKKISSFLISEAFSIEF